MTIRGQKVTGAIVDGHNYTSHAYVTREIGGRNGIILVHSNISCWRIKDKGTVGYEPITLDPEGGVKLHGYRAKWCKDCPEQMDMSWRDKALCWDLYPTVDFFAPTRQERAKIISKYCDNCPVALQCLEYGASDLHNWGGIFGGVYFGLQGHDRKRRIEQRRKELLRG